MKDKVSGVLQRVGRSFMLPIAILPVVGNIVFENLPIIFAMVVAIGMAKKEKVVAALSVLALRRFTIVFTRFSFRRCFLWRHRCICGSRFSFS